MHCLRNTKLVCLQPGGMHAESRTAAAILQAMPCSGNGDADQQRRCPAEYALRWTQTERNEMECSNLKLAHLQKQAAMRIQAKIADRVQHRKHCP